MVHLKYLYIGGTRCGVFVTDQRVFTFFLNQQTFSWHQLQCAIHCFRDRYIFRTCWFVHNYASI